MPAMETECNLCSQMSKSLGEEVTSTEIALCRNVELEFWHSAVYTEIWVELKCLGRDKRSTNLAPCLAQRSVPPLRRGEVVVFQPCSRGQNPSHSWLWVGAG